MTKLLDHKHFCFAPRTVLYGLFCAPCMMCDVAHSLDEWTWLMVCTGGGAIAPMRTKLRHTARIEARHTTRSLTQQAALHLSHFVHLDYWNRITRTVYCSRAGLHVLRLFNHVAVHAVCALPNAPRA